MIRGIQIRNPCLLYLMKEIFVITSRVHTQLDLNEKKETFCLKKQRK